MNIINWLFLPIRIIYRCLYFFLNFRRFFWTLIQHNPCINNAICCFNRFLNHVPIFNFSFSNNSFFLLFELFKQFLLLHLFAMHFLQHKVWHINFGNKSLSFKIFFLRFFTHTLQKLDVHLHVKELTLFLLQRATNAFC